MNNEEDDLITRSQKQLLEDNHRLFENLKKKDYIIKRKEAVIEELKKHLTEIEDKVLSLEAQVKLLK